jgi:hypothetical protein
MHHMKLSPLRRTQRARLMRRNASTAYLLPQIRLLSFGMGKYWDKRRRTRDGDMRTRDGDMIPIPHSFTLIAAPQGSTTAAHPGQAKHIPMKEIGVNRHLNVRSTLNIV